MQKRRPSDSPDERDGRTAADALPYPYGPWIKLLILTAQRRDEVSHMTWSEVDLDAGLWTIPKERAKNDQAHHVHLSPVPVELLRTLPRWEGTEFVFTATGRTPISAFSDAEGTLDARVVAALLKKGNDRGNTPDSVKPLPDWRFHDLRRTAATMTAEMDVPPHVVDKILNHTQGTIKGVAAIYNRHRYLDERKLALGLWSDRLNTLSSDGQSDSGPSLPTGPVEDCRPGDAETGHPSSHKAPASRACGTAAPSSFR